MYQVTPLPLRFYCLHMYPSTAYCSVLLVLKLHKKYRILFAFSSTVTLVTILPNEHPTVYSFYCQETPGLLSGFCDYEQFSSEHYVSAHVALLLKGSSSQTLCSQDPHSLFTVENDWGTWRAPVYVGHYLSMFTVLETKTQAFKNYLKYNKFITCKHL